MRKRTTLNRVIWLMFLGGALVFGSYFAYRYFFVRKPSESAYQAIKVSRGDIKVTILSTGVVTPKNRLDIKPPVSGRVDKLLVDEGDIVSEGQTLAWMSSNERAGLMDSASAKGAAVVKEWEKLFKPTPILAPIAGTIIKRNVVPGQSFGTGDAVFTMSDRLTVNAQVDETDIGKIELNQKAVITLDAYPDVQTTGRVLKIAFDATTVNSVTTYNVDVAPEKIPKVMRSGMTANVTFDIETRSNILVIPVGAIKTRDGKSFVLTPAKAEGEEPLERPITTGLTDGKRVELLSGLNEGDTLLTPEFKLKDSNSGASPFSPMGRPAPKKPAS